jgi:transposase
MSESDRLHFWTEMLRLKDFQVIHVQQDTPSDPLRFTLRPRLDVAPCPHCQKLSDTIHRTTTSDRIKDLPVGPNSVELTVRTLQFHCLHCDSFFTPGSSFFVPGTHATERFLEQAARLIRFSDIQNAATFLGLPEKTLDRWYYDYLERLQQTSAQQTKPIRQIGIDELSLKKGIAST